MYAWPRDGLIPAASAVLESLWAYAWISFMLAAAASTSHIRYPYPWVLALLFVPAVAGRFLDRSYWGPKIVRQHGLTVIVVVLFVGFMIPFHAAGAAWLAAAALLARGVWLGLGNIGSDAAAAWFLAGFAAFLSLLAIGLMAHPAAWDPDRSQLGPMLVIYLFGGLSLLALVRRQEMEERAFRRPVHELNGTWLLLLGAISAVMLAVVGLVSFGGTGIARGILQVIALIAALVWEAAIFVVVNWLGPALLWLFSHIPGGGDGGRLGNLLRRRPPSDLDARILAWLRTHIPIEVVLALTGAILMVLVATWLALRIVARDPGADDEERTSLWSWRGFLLQLARWLRGLRGLRPAHLSLATVGTPPPAPVQDSVRQLYARALLRCREADRLRQPAQTPLEFQPVLSDELDAELGPALTSAYLRARYAESAVPDAEVQRMRERWDALARSNSQSA
ncbi:MAG TPA: DUF4129 domain-containing protein [Chloroflexota bacterium]|nr:DUF4129 domain-containing protein [Chloroflexota bacterium]